VLADLPLDQLIEAHCRSENIATLALRSSGAEKRIQCDPASGSITDLRGLLGGRDEPAFVFTGISVFSPEIHNHIPGGEPISIIPVLADLLRDGAPIGGVVLVERPGASGLRGIVAAAALTAARTAAVSGAGLRVAPPTTDRARAGGALSAAIIGGGVQAVTHRAGSQAQRATRAVR
jgi:NDP-sugar pyrophosphorylase family protein